MINVEKAIAAIKAVDQLGYELLFRTDGTYCAIGALLKAIGYSDDRLREGLYGDCYIRLECEYGLFESHWKKIIAVNDTTNPEYRKQRVIETIKELANGQR